MLARGLRFRGSALRQIPIRSSPFLISPSAFGPHVAVLQLTTRTRTTAFNSGRDDTSLYLHPTLLKSTPWSFLIVVGATLTAALLLDPYFRQVNRSEPPPSPSPQKSLRTRPPQTIQPVRFRATIDTLKCPYLQATLATSRLSKNSNCGNSGL